MIHTVPAAQLRVLQRRFIAFCSFILIAGLLAVPAGILSVRAQETAMSTPAITTTPTSEPFSSDVDLPPLPEQYDADVPLPAPENPRSAGDTQTSDTAIMSSPRRFQYAFRLIVRGIYDDNINYDHADPISDFYLSIDPIVVLAFGDAGERKDNFVQFDYRPRLFFFADHSDNNAFENVVRLEGQYSLRRLKIHATQEIQLLDGAEVDVHGVTDSVSSRVNLDVAGRTELNLYTTQVDATYDFSSKTFLTGGVSYVKADYPDLISSEGVSANVNLNYHYSPKLDVGIGGLFGLDRNDLTADQTYQQANVRLGYSATGKLTLIAAGGVEFRQFDEPGVDQYVTPIFSLGATYKPFDGTVIVVNGSRRTYNSAVLAGQDYTNTSLSVSFRQRLLRRIQVGLNAGFENSEYVSAINGVTATREDNYFFVQPGIDVTITRYWTVGAFYLHRQNDSSVDDFGFRGNQVGIISTLTF